MPPSVRERNLIERFFSKLKHFRQIAPLRQARDRRPRYGPTRLNPAVAARL
jgi:transposase